MDDFGKFALELLKLGGAGVASAVAVSWLTSRRFATEKHWQTKFDHYNGIHHEMGRMLTHILGQLQPHLDMKEDEKVTLESPGVQTFATMSRHLCELESNAELVLSPEAIRIATDFWSKALVTDASKPHYFSLWKDWCREFEELMRNFRMVARRDLGFEPQPTPIARLLRWVVDRRRFFRVPKDSVQGDPRT